MKTIDKVLDTESLEFNDEVQKLKNKYGTIYQIEVAEQRFIFKPLSRKEYKEVMGKEYDITDSNEEVIFARENMIAELCIVYPNKDITKDMIDKYAGIAEVIAEECMKVSGFVSERERTVTKL